MTYQHKQWLLYGWILLIMAVWSVVGMIEVCKYGEHCILQCENDTVINITKATLTLVWKEETVNKKQYPTSKQCYTQCHGNVSCDFVVEWSKTEDVVYTFDAESSQLNITYTCLNDPRLDALGISVTNEEPQNKSNEDKGAAGILKVVLIAGLSTLFVLILIAVSLYIVWIRQEQSPSSSSTETCNCLSTKASIPPRKPRLAHPEISIHRRDIVHNVIYSGDVTNSTAETLINTDHPVVKVNNAKPQSTNVLNRYVFEEVEASSSRDGSYVVLKETQHTQKGEDAWLHGKDEEEDDDDDEMIITENELYSASKSLDNKLIPDNGACAVDGDQSESPDTCLYLNVTSKNAKDRNMSGNEDDDTIITENDLYSDFQSLNTRPNNGACAIADGQTVTPDPDLYASVNLRNTKAHKESGLFDNEDDDTIITENDLYSDFQSLGTKHMLDNGACAIDDDDDSVSDVYVSGNLGNQKSLEANKDEGMSPDTGFYKNVNLANPEVHKDGSDEYDTILIENDLYEDFKSLDTRYVLDNGACALGADDGKPLSTDPSSPYSNLKPKGHKDSDVCDYDDEDETIITENDLYSAAPNDANLYSSVKETPRYVKGKDSGVCEDDDDDDTIVTENELYSVVKLQDRVEPLNPAEDSRTTDFQIGLFVLILIGMASFKQL